MTSLLSLGMRAMFANQAALQTVGQNIANANTPGYSRQSTILTTPDGQYTGAGYFGKGVDVQTVVRSHNAFLTKEAVSAKSTASMDTTRMEQMAQLEKLFPTGEMGIGYAASQFFNAMTDVSTRPADPSARQVVLGRAAELAARFATAGAQLDDLQAGVVSDLRNSVGQINQLAKQIAEANEHISASIGTGHTPNDMLDQRDQMISKLSEFIQVTTLPASNGSLGVFIGGGQRLVLGSEAMQLSVEQDPYDASRATLSIMEANGPRALDPSTLSGGSVTALVLYQNQDLQDARNLLGQMAVAVSTRVNAQQALGLDLSDPPGAGAPIFATGPSRTLPSANNLKDDAGNFLSRVNVTITDSSFLQASSYKLDTNPAAPGTYRLTRLSDGLVRTVADGDTVDGFKIDFNGGGPPAPTDSFLLEPVAKAASGMKRVLDNTNGIAAASPLTASTDVDNKGTATIASFFMANTLALTAQTPMSIEFGDPDPLDARKLQYTMTLNDGSQLTGTWAAGTPIGNQPNAVPPINLGFELMLNGVPRTGDLVTVDKTKFPLDNNGNAQAFLNIQNETFVGRRLLPDGSVALGATVNDAYAAAMSDIGSRVQGATYLSGVSTAAAADAEASRSSQSGVNIDEEATKLMQYQQGYQAAAKVLQVAQTLFDELLQLSR